jgi:phosphatidylglycerol lysyltransferase
MNNQFDKSEEEPQINDEYAGGQWPSPPTSTKTRDRLAVTWGVLKRDWPIWLVTLVTFANGLLSILQTLFIRFPQHPRLFGFILPFGLFHWSRSLSVVLGFILIYLSFQLSQHRRVAWWVAVVASAIAMLVHFTNRQLWYTAPAPVATFALLIIFRKRFSVRSELRNIAQGIALLIASVVIAIGYGTLGFWLLDQRDFGITFSLQDGALRTLREFSLVDNSDLVAQTRYAHWFLQSLDILGIVAGLFAIYSLFRPVAYRLRVLPHEQVEAKAILARYGRSSYDYFKVWPDKSYFFSNTRRSFISYRTVMGVAFCLGDPIGPGEELKEVTNSFLHYCSENGWLALFLMPESLAMYESLGLSPLKIGEEAVIDLELFSSHTAERKYFRYVRRKFEGEGYQVIRYIPPHAPKLIDEAEELSKEWLSLPHHREFGFVQGRFERSYVAGTTLFFLRDSIGRLIAFINQIPSYRSGEATFDMMRHKPGTHWGTMDYLFTRLMLILKEEGYRTFNLGLAPFARVSTRPGVTLTERAINQLFEHLDWFVHSKGLRQYKVKFEPVWESRFVAYQGGPIGLARMAIAITRVL